MDVPKIDFRYLKEAFKEPLNFWGMAGFAIAAAYVQDVTPLLAALAAEAVYLAVLPATPFYRRLVERREKERARKLRDAQREAAIKAFDPREREAVENFFGLVNDQVVTLPTPERVSALHFEELSDSIAMTRQMLEETADTFGMLDHQNRELDLLLASGSSAK